MAPLFNLVNAKLFKCNKVLCVCVIHFKKSIQAFDEQLWYAKFCAWQHTNKYYMASVIHPVFHSLKGGFYILSAFYSHLICREKIIIGAERPGCRKDRREAAAEDLTQGRLSHT